MRFAVRLRRYVPVFLALWHAAFGLIPAARGGAAGPGGLADLFTPPTADPILPSLPPLQPSKVEEGPHTAAEENFAAFTSFEGLRQPGDREMRKLSNKAESEWGGSFSSEVAVRAPEHTWDTPFERGEWSREDTLNIPLAGPLFLVGSAGLTGEYVADQNMKVVGRTHALLKVAVSEERELELRGGPTIKVNDALRPASSKDQTSILLEVQAKWPIVHGIGLEYSGEALPAMTPLDRPKLNQDIGLAFPLSGGKVKLGAKHHWEQLQDARTSTTNMELYVGIEIGR